MGRSRFRIRAFMLALAVLLFGCVLRAVQLQTFDAQAFAAEAAAKMQNTRELLPERGPSSIATGWCETRNRDGDRR